MRADCVPFLDFIYNFPFDSDANFLCHCSIHVYFSGTLLGFDYSNSLFPGNSLVLHASGELLRDSFAEALGNYSGFWGSSG